MDFKERKAAFKSYCREYLTKLTLKEDAVAYPSEIVIKITDLTDGQKILLKRFLTGLGL